MSGHLNSSSVALRPDAGQGHFTLEASRSHSDTAYSVGLLWTSDQPDAESFTWKYTTLETKFHAPDGQTHALDRSGHWDRLSVELFNRYYSFSNWPSIKKLGDSVAVLECLW
jgi:hypothetical protein